jgi:hypothetical protein
MGEEFFSWNQIQDHHPIVCLLSMAGLLMQGHLLNPFLTKSVYEK